MVSQQVAYKKIKCLVLAGVICGIFFVAGVSQAATSTLRGKAWWGDTQEYLYFNCLDDEIGEQLDIPGNFIDGFEFYVEPCSGFDHRVEIDANNNFTGSAWNRVEGLVDFAGVTTPPDNYSFNSNCLSTCNASNSCWACYNENNNQIYGWAKSTVSEEWLQLDSATTDVKIQPANAGVWLGYSLSAGDFVGTSTSALGNVSFNCLSEGTCGSRDYKVYIGNVQATGLSAPNWSAANACASGALDAVLRWSIKSGQQSAYEIVVNNTNTFSTSSAICWSGKEISEDARQYIVPNSNDNLCISSASFDYGQNYYWWLRLYDENGSSTEWHQYANNTSGDDGGDPDSNPLTFTTYLHEFPDVNFSWLPAGDDVVVGTSTLFDGRSSQYYATGAGSIPVDCSSGYCFYAWSITDPNAVISSSTDSTTTIDFFSATSTTVSLSIIDQDNYVCSGEHAFNSNYGLPIWREIKAE